MPGSFSLDNWSDTTSSFNNRHTDAITSISGLLFRPWPVTSMPKRLLAFKLKELGDYLRHHAPRLITRHFTSCQPKSHSLIGNLWDYCLYHNQSSTFSTRGLVHKQTYRLPKEKHFQGNPQNINDVIMIPACRGDTFLRCGNCLPKAVAKALNYKT